MRSKVAVVESPAFLLALVLQTLLTLCPVLAGQQPRHAVTGVIGLFNREAEAFVAPCASQAKQQPCVSLAGQQPFGSHLIRVRPFTTIDDVLNREAEASDPAGIHQFSQDLIGLVVPDQAGLDYLDSITSRLARAEEKAREGKGRLIPEAQIVRVFNDQMRQIGAPRSFKTDEATVRKFRKYSIAEPSLPALLTASHNGTFCTPAEAVYLLYLMLSCNGSLPNSILDDEAKLTRQMKSNPKGFSVIGVTSCRAPEDASWYLSSYSSRHDRATAIKLFNHMAKSFRF